MHVALLVSNTRLPRKTIDDQVETRQIACTILKSVGMDCGGLMWNFEMRDIASRTRKAPRVAVAGPLIATYAPPETDTGAP